MCMLWIRIPVIRSGLTAEKKREKREKGVDKEEESWYSN